MLLKDRPDVLSRRSLRYGLPNLLTYGRILAVPLLALCFYLPSPVSHWAAFGVFVAASVTDFFDGYLARAWHQESAIGRMLDPIADKMLVGGALFMLGATQVIGYWSLIAGVVILNREYAVSGLREFLADLKVKVPVTYLAKAKTTFQMFAIAVLLISPVADGWFYWHAINGPVANFTGLVLLWSAAGVTVITGFSYFRAGITQIKEDDE